MKNSTRAQIRFLENQLSMVRQNLEALLIADAKSPVDKVGPVGRKSLNEVLTHIIQSQSSLNRLVTQTEYIMAVRTGEDILEVIKRAINLAQTEGNVTFTFTSVPVHVNPYSDVNTVYKMWEHDYHLIVESSL